MAFRDQKGRFSRIRKRKTAHSCLKANFDCHDYALPVGPLPEPGAYVEVTTTNDNWKVGRRLVEFDVLLKNLRTCQSCCLGPLSFTYDSVVGELQKGLGGYLYVKCELCDFVNKVAYGKTHHVKSRGMPCFDANTKLGSGVVKIYTIVENRRDQTIKQDQTARL